MKLTIELVPATTWYSNLRNQLAREDWDKIRKRAYVDAGHQCAICHAKSKLSCHEIWAYDDTHHVQTLEGFLALCDNCHMIKHIGFANIQASQGLLDMELLIRHFMTVNSVSREAFEQHRDESFALWERRSKHHWRTDLAQWSKLVKARGSGKGVRCGK